MSVNCHMIK
ncbi:hypothetical protein Tsp_06396, partial [Trichinella spiralis]